MAGPGDEMAAAAAGRGHLRASHADREQVIGTLKAAFVQGRLTQDEFDLRVGRAFASRTYAELAALTADLPAGLAAARPPGRPAPARVLRPTKNLALTWAVCGFIPPAVFFGFLHDNPITWSVFVTLSGFYFMLWLAFGLAMCDAWHQQRSGGQRSRRQRPPGPAQRGQAPGDRPDREIGDDRTLCEVRQVLTPAACPVAG
jgi:Domain of unknown function (DUF1707)